MTSSERGSVSFVVPSTQDIPGGCEEAPGPRSPHSPHCPPNDSARRSEPTYPTLSGLNDDGAGEGDVSTHRRAKYDPTVGVLDDEDAYGKTRTTRRRVAIEPMVMASVSSGVWRDQEGQDLTLRSDENGIFTVKSHKTRTLLASGGTVGELVRLAYPDRGIVMGKLCRGGEEIVFDDGTTWTKYVFAAIEGPTTKGAGPTTKGAGPTTKGAVSSDAQSAPQNRMKLAITSQADFTADMVLRRLQYTATSTSKAKAQQVRAEALDAMKKNLNRLLGFIHKGNAATVRSMALLSSFPEVCRKADASGLSAIHHAALLNRVAIGSLLLSEGRTPPNLRTVNAAKASPLHAACEQGCFEFVELLLRQTSIDVNAISSDGRTPLYVAAQSGHMNCIRLLIEPWLVSEKCRKCEPADVNVVASDGTTALHAASISAHEDIVHLLLVKHFAKVVWSKATLGTSSSMLRLFEEPACAPAEFRLANERSQQSLIGRRNAQTLHALRHLHKRMNGRVEAFRLVGDSPWISFQKELDQNGDKHIDRLEFLAACRDLYEMDELTFPKLVLDACFEVLCDSHSIDRNATIDMSELLAFVRVTRGEIAEFVSVDGWAVFGGWSSFRNRSDRGEVRLNGAESKHGKLELPKIHADRERSKRQEDWWRREHLGLCMSHREGAVARANFESTYGMTERQRPLSPSRLLPPLSHSPQLHIAHFSRILRPRRDISNQAFV